MKSPNHIAIIMDGNGRWGIKKYSNRLVGHEYGVKNIKFVINYFLKKKIKNLTLFALSSDNLRKRSYKEIRNIFLLLEKYLDTNVEFFTKNKIKLNFIGETKNLSIRIRKIILKYNKITNFKKKKLLINIAFNYSSKQEIVHSCKQILKNKEDLNLKNIEKNLYTSPIKDPEILIRTGGFARLSDFLLWQCSYSEIFFVKKLWPDFKITDLDLIIKKFLKLKRKFGS